MGMSKKTSVRLIFISGFLLTYKLYLVVASIVSIISARAASEAASIGIIGGADGPTAIFLTSKLLPHYILPLFCILLEIFLYVFILVGSIKAIRK